MSQRAPRPKPGELRLKWAKLPEEPSPGICIAWGGGGAGRADASLLHDALCSPINRYMQPEQDKSLVDELVARGYDITTITFSIKRKGV